MKEKETASINFGLWQLLQRSLGAIIKVRQKELDRFGITVRQSAVLRTVMRLGQQATPTEIAKQLFLESNTISEQLQRMEADGLVKKVKDLNRKNLVRIEVTQEGHELSSKTLNRKSIDYVMSVLTEDEKIELWSILTKLRGRAVEKLDIKDLDLYPPSDYSSLWPSDNTKPE
mgnify:CR=1 FL=1